VAGLLTAAIASTDGFAYFLFAMVLTVIYLLLAYSCWNLKDWAFLASSVLAIVVASLALSIIYSPIGSLLILLQLQITFFAFRAYRELKN